MPKRGYKHSEETKRKISIANSNPSEETRRKRSLANLGEKNPFYGKHHTEETKKKIGDLGRGREKTEEELLKLRNSQIKYVEEVRMKGGIFYPCIGRYEKRIIDIFENVTGYTFIRQFKTHGFFIDGYCSMLKLAIEVDENYHNNQIEKDIKRQEYLEREIGCSFIRINVGDKK